MFQISRSIYRELEADIVEDRLHGDGPSNRECVLRACEAAVMRLTTDRHYFARPSRTLFNDIRIYFPMSAQLRVWNVVERYLAFADEFFQRQPMHGFDVGVHALRHIPRCGSGSRQITRLVADKTSVVGPFQCRVGEFMSIESDEAVGDDEPRTCVRGSFARGVACVEFFERSIEVVRIEHDGRRNLFIGVVLDEQQNIVCLLYTSPSPRDS